MRGDIVKIFNGKDITEEIISVKEFIFSHDFAKAFWGTRCGSIIAKGISGEQCHEYVGESWQYHLQQMVLEKDHIKYLEKFL